jgi:hypothetical protein
MASFGDERFGGATAGEKFDKTVSRSSGDLTELFRKLQSIFQIERASAVAWVVVLGRPEYCAKKIPNLL